MYYYTDTFKYLLIYQNIDSDDENADTMSNDDAMKTQLKEENIQKLNDSEKFETAIKY